MTNSNLIKKLHNLAYLEPDKEWLHSNRDLLLSQISNSGAEKLSFWKTFFINLKTFSKTVSRPVYALALFVALLASATLLSQRALTKVKPDDSLYIARVIAEQVKLNTTFNTQDRNRLAVRYAVSHAQDINSVMANPHFNNSSNQAQIAKLSSNFNQEVKTIKSKINVLNTENTVDQKIKSKTISNSVKSNKLTASVSPKESDFIIADSAHTKKGISLAISSSTRNNLASNTASSTLASSTLNNIATTSSIEKADQIIDEAQKLFNSKNYTQAGLKLDEASNIINNGQ